MSQRIDVVWARTGAEALQWVSEQPFDVALVEVSLSDVSGVDLIRLLNERAPALLPILIASRPSLESAVAAVRVGAFDYLLKPVDDVRLVQVVREAARAKRVIDAHGLELAREDTETTEPAERPPRADSRSAPAPQEAPRPGRNPPRRRGLFVGAPGARTSVQS